MEQVNNTSLSLLQTSKRSCWKIRVLYEIFVPGNLVTIFMYIHDHDFADISSSCRGIALWIMFCIAL